MAKQPPRAIHTKAELDLARKYDDDARRRMAGKAPSAPGEKYRIFGQHGGNPYHDSKGKFTNARGDVATPNDGYSGEPSIPQHTDEEDRALNAAILKAPFKPFDEYPKETVDISTLVARQARVSPNTIDLIRAGVDQYGKRVKKSDHPDLPFVIGFRGMNFVYDGHHRIEAQIRDGARRFLVHRQVLEE